MLFERLTPDSIPHCPMFCRAEWANKPFLWRMNETMSRNLNQLCSLQHPTERCKNIFCKKNAFAHQQKLSWDNKSRREKFHSILIRTCFVSFTTHGLCTLHYCSTPNAMPAIKTLLISANRTNRIRNKLKWKSECCIWCVCAVEQYFPVQCTHHNRIRPRQKTKQKPNRCTLMANCLCLAGCHCTIFHAITCNGERCRYCIRTAIAIVYCYMCVRALVLSCKRIAIEWVQIQKKNQQFNAVW